MTYFFSLDSLTIFDGGSMLANPYCGYSIPSDHVSSSNKIFIHFHSDSSITRSGFKMKYNPTGKQNKSILYNTYLYVLRFFKFQALMMLHLNKKSKVRGLKFLKIKKKHFLDPESAEFEIL